LHDTYRKEPSKNKHCGAQTPTELTQAALGLLLSTIVTEIYRGLPQYFEANGSVVPLNRQKGLFMFLLHSSYLILLSYQLYITSVAETALLNDKKVN
jgi:hypothetical protein